MAIDLKGFDPAGTIVFVGRVEVRVTSVGFAYPAGQRLLVDSPSKSFGTVEAGTTQTILFSLMNKTGAPIVVLGGKSTCGCTVATDLPMAIPAGGWKRVPLVVRTSKPEDFTASVRLYTDFPELGEISLQVRGCIEGSIPKAENLATQKESSS